MIERGIDAEAVYWLGVKVWGGIAWRHYDALKLEDIAGIDERRLDYATDALLDLPPELQWPFWAMNDPRLAKHERHCVIRRFTLAARSSSREHGARHTEARAAAVCRP